MSHYLLYQPNHQPFVAFPLGSSSRALALFPAATWKKKAIRSFLRLADSLQLPLPNVIRKKNLSIFSMPDHAILEDLNREQPLPYQPLLWMWNREYQRRRIYLWLENNQNQQLMAFVKIGQGKVNKHDFAREFNALISLHSQQTTFNTPEPYTLETFNNISSLVTSPLPIPLMPFRYLPWSTIEKHLTPVTMRTKKEISHSQLHSTGWFKAFQATLKQETLQKIQKHFVNTLLSVGFIHGDMGSENSFNIEGQLWLIDWERSSNTGPIITDEVAHWLGKTAANAGLGDSIIQGFLCKFINNTKFCGHDVLLALCYLQFMSFPPADFLFKTFQKDNFSPWM